MDKSWSILAVAAYVYSEVQINFCEAPTSGIHLHRKSVIPQALYLWLLITILITTSPPWDVYQFWVPSDTVKEF